MGVPISAAYFYERYRRPVPREGERTLRFDDANLYQYHLLHGVLTINEVRGTLGLPAVPWGDQPTGRNAGMTGGDGLGMPPTGSAENDADEPDGERDEGLADRRDL